MLMQGNGSVMSAAIQFDAVNSWAGYGLPAQPDYMIGADAIIVKPCSSCPTGEPATIASL